MVLDSHCVVPVIGNKMNASSAQSSSSNSVACEDGGIAQSKHLH